MMSFDFPILNSLLFEYEVRVVLAAFLVEICAMLGQELIIACNVQ